MLLVYVRCGFQEIYPLCFDLSNSSGSVDSAILLIPIPICSAESSSEQDRMKDDSYLFWSDRYAVGDMSSTVPPLCLDEILFEYSKCVVRNRTMVVGKKRGMASSMIRRCVFLAADAEKRNDIGWL